MNFRVLLIWLITGMSSYGIGSYPVSPDIGPNPNQADLFDGLRYNLGKDIVARRVKLDEEAINSGSKGIQLNILEHYAEKLPESVREKYDLPGLAGRLSADRLEAVTYFLTIRFKLEEQAPAPQEDAPIRLAPRSVMIPIPQSTLDPVKPGKP